MAEFKHQFEVTVESINVDHLKYEEIDYNPVVDIFQTRSIFTNYADAKLYYDGIPINETDNKLLQEVSIDIRTEKISIVHNY